MTAIQPQLWVDRGRAAVSFYEAAFGAHVLHLVGEGEDVVAQLAAGDAVFWVAAAGQSANRLVPRTNAGAASARFLLVVEDPDVVFEQAVAAGAEVGSAVAEEHGWRVGRLTDPFGHEWEIGRHLAAGSPARSSTR